VSKRYWEVSKTGARVYLSERESEHPIGIPQHWQKWGEKSSVVDPKESRHEEGTRCDGRPNNGT
jgi:hypothetical protein